MVSDSGARVLEFDPHSGRRDESMNKTYLLPKVLVIPRKLFDLRPVFVRSIESFLITSKVYFLYFRGFCVVMFPGSHVL